MTRHSPLKVAAFATLLLATAAPATAQMAAQPAAPVVKIETREDVVVPAGVEAFNIKDFDLNGDGVLVRAEVGERLFKLYDVDGNGVIDNIEYQRRAITTLQPVERTTTISYDLTGNGTPDKQETTHERFLRETQLSHFDKNNKGLSARDLLDRSFASADVDNDKFISLREWRGAYDAAIDHSNHVRGSYNN